jgi:hypothetical protein
MPKPEIPRGCVLVRIEDLAALLAAQYVPAPPEPSRKPEDAWAGLGAAIALVTERLGHQDVGHGQLADGIPAECIIGPLVAMAAAGLRGCLDDGAEKLLQDMGLIALSRGHGPDGRPL